MKRMISYISATAVLVLCSFAPAYAGAPPVPVVPVPEPSTMAVLGAIAAGGIIARIARKIIKRK